jgi:uncharacterized membrane protein
MDKARVESFSDGVFAFAITLLVLGFQVPDLRVADEPSLRKALFQQFPQAIPYVTSFATIGIIWLNHHAMFHELHHVERGTLTLNLILLMVVSFIPYPTAVLGRYGALPASAVLYGVVLTLLGITYNILWRHIVQRKLSKQSADSEKQRSRTQRNLVGAFGYPLGTAIAFTRPKAAGLTYLVLALFYFVPEHTLRATEIWTVAKRVWRLTRRTR